MGVFRPVAGKLWVILELEMADTRTVYRYENDKGEGPYRHHHKGYENPLQSMCNSHADGAHPAWSLCMSCLDPWGCDCDDYAPEVDEDEVTSDYVAACASREALDAWFDGWHEQLAANGFKVVEYTVPAENVVDGYSGLQCAFLPVAV